MRATPRARVRRAALFLVAHVFNPVALAITRRQHRVRFAILEHRGRRSGRLYVTPVEVRRTRDDRFIIPLTWGDRTDWFQNICAAGSCVIRWHGTMYTLIDPQVVDDASAGYAFHPLERLILRLAGVRFVRLRQPSTPAQASG